MNQTEEKKSRLELLLDAHPFLTDTQARALLITFYKQVTRSPAYRGPEDLEVQMAARTDILCRMDEHSMRNEVAKAAEHFELSWEELTAELLNDE